MTTHPEPTDPDRIVRLARGVLDDYERTDDWNKQRSRSGREMPPYEVMFARAVIELTAQLDAERFAHANTGVKVKRVEALADGLEREADKLGDSGSGLAVHSGSVKGRVAARIRAALNGERHD